MPKNDKGRLDPTVVRYALHRYFAQKYGWHLRGLEPSGGAWNASSPAIIMKDRAPAYIQGLVANRMHGQGFGLVELAVFAATLMDLIQHETVADLDSIYAAMRVSEGAMLPADAIDGTLKAYLVSYIKGAHVQASDQWELFKLEEELIDGCIVWFEAESWMQDLRRTIDFTHRAGRNPFKQTHYSFDQVAEVAQEVGHRFGAFQNLECRSLKEKLVEMEHAGSGRVTLAKFYSGVEDRDWPFIESVEYLRNLGALDETDPRRPSVIIPNFLSSPTNCIAPSSFYSVCCIDECEGLLAHVERSIGEPSSTVSRLAEVVSGLESDTVEAPRNLSVVQHARLGVIATIHGGRIPLHGRLFAQWMHHAYPRECRFPHVAGTTNPLDVHEFTKQFGLDVEASDEEIDQHTANEIDAPMEADLLIMPWTNVEELIAPHSQLSGALDKESHSSSSLRVLMFLAALASAAFPMAHARKLQRIGDKKEMFWI